MHNRFDNLGKDIGMEALAPCGLTVIQDEIVPVARHADLRHEPAPGRGADRRRLGLLGRIAAVLCLIEIYSGAPDEDEALACVGKLIAFRQQRRRDARKKRRRTAHGHGRGNKRRTQAARFVRPFVWIITARRPTGVLAALAAIEVPGWLRGVYFGPGVLRRAGGRGRLGGLVGAGGLFRVGVIVAGELPRVRSTILVRLMAGGPLLPEAIADLEALPADAHERAVSGEILLRLRDAIRKKAKRTQEEQEFIVSTQSISEQLVERGRKAGLREGLREGRDKGLRKGRDEGKRSHARAMLRRVLAKRQLAPSRKDEAQIDGCDELRTLDRWIEQALTAESVGEALRVGAAPARRRRAARPS
jgi:hypothetical protein